MMMTQITGDAPLEVQLAQAKADVEPAKEAQWLAEKQLGSAVYEVQRLRKLFGRFNAEAALLSQKSRKVKERALSLTCRELDASASWRELYEVTADRRKVTDSLQYVASWSIPEAEISELEATITERERTADLLECQAVVQRLALAFHSAAACEYDPGVKLDVSSSWSSETMNRVAHIRSVEIPALRAELLTKRKATEDERSTVAVNLFS